MRRNLSVRKCRQEPVTIKVSRHISARMNQFRVYEHPPIKLIVNIIALSRNKSSVLSLIEFVTQKIRRRRRVAFAVSRAISRHKHVAASVSCFQTEGQYDKSVLSAVRFADLWSHSRKNSFATATIILHE